MISGKIIDGRYEIIEEIGRGGMAIVFRAKCMVLNRYVAIKMLRPEYRNDLEFIKRFKIEAQSAGSLSHPNIVSVYDVGNEDDMEYIVMEYVEGITLKQYLGAKSILPWKEAVDYASQICAGLEHAHKKGIVHKDIKPENIMITKEGILKITDFGIAKALNQGTITTGGLTMGSVHYFSPEQARGSYTDAKTDLYSLGILIYEMIAGRLPFEGESAISIAMQHLESEPVRPSVFNPAIPKSLEAVILKALKKDQNDRYQTATQMLIDLKKVYIGSEVRYETTEEYTRKYRPVTPETETKKNAPQARAGAAEERKTSSRAEVQKSKKKKKKADALGIAAGVLSGIALIALAIWGWTFMTGGSKNEVECPELVNHTCAEALQLIEGTNLKIVQENGTEITASDEGLIVSQSPKSGIKVKKNAKITVTLGEAPAKTVKIPALANKTEESAISALKALKLDVTIERKDSNDVQKGQVIESHPAAGTSVSEGATVTLYISNGKINNDDEYTLVPNLLGKTESEARKILEDANLLLGEIQYVNNAKEKGTIVSQSEAEGNRVKKNKAISIKVSNGTAASASPSPSPTPSSSPSPAVTPSNPAVNTEPAGNSAEN